MPEYDYTDPAEIVLDEQIASTTSLVGSDGGNAFLQAVSETWASRGTLHGEMFDHVGETLEPAQFAAFFTELRKQPFGEGAVRRTLSSALTDHRLDVQTTLFAALGPAYGVSSRGELPPDLTALWSWDGGDSLPTDALMMEDTIRDESESATDADPEDTSMNTS
jgi:hypothetical protein